MKFEKLKQAQKILIYGYGLEGKSSLRFLRNHFPGKTIEAFDEKREVPETLRALSDLDSYDVWIMSPGVDRRKFSPWLRERMTSQTELFFENISEKKRWRTIGVSGTKGKSMTVKFCFEVLQNGGKRTVIGGNYGVPLLDFFDDFEEKDAFDFVVAELSSYQLEFLKVSPGVAIFLNIFPEHIDRHGDYEHYIEAKKNLWRFQRSDDIVITPEKIKPFIEETKRNNLFVSSDLPEEYFPKNSIFRAQHFRQNFGTVLEFAKILDIPVSIIADTAKNFKGLPHRIEFVARVKQIDFYDDSISTIPNSAYVAIQFFGNRLGSVIFGGKDRGVAYDLLARGLKKFAPQAFVIILDSETKPALLSAMASEKIKHFALAKNLEEAVRIGLEKTIPKKVCLLSPAASSFDRFRDYIQRGDEFQKWVRELEKEL